LAFKEVYQNPDKYEIYPQLSKSKQVPEKNLTETVANLDIFAASINSHADSIRKYNPWILGNTIPVNAGEALNIFTPLYPTNETTDLSIIASDKKSRDAESDIAEE
jgi:hypothetical protein